MHATVSLFFTGVTDEANASETGGGNAELRKSIVSVARAGHETGMNYLVAGLIGLVGGLASGLFGVGGGVVMVPAMIYFMQLDPHRAVGTSLVVIIPTALTGMFKHHAQGNVVWNAALALIPMALVGGYLGAWLTKYLSGGDLKRAFGGFLVLVGLRLLFFK